MKRRSFLAALGISSVASPVVAKALDVPPQEPQREPLGIEVPWSTINFVQLSPLQSSRLGNPFIIRQDCEIMAIESFPEKARFSIHWGRSTPVMKGARLKAGETLSMRTAEACNVLVYVRYEPSHVNITVNVSAGTDQRASEVGRLVAAELRRSNPSPV